MQLTIWLWYMSVTWTLVVQTELLDPSDMNSAVATKSREDTGKGAQQSPVIIVYRMYLNYFFLILP